MTATLTIEEIDMIQAALYCLLDHPDRIIGLTHEEVEKIVNHASYKLENATYYRRENEQLAIII